MKFVVALKLGRVSNLPTVWSNVLTGMALAGTATADGRLLILVASLSLFYVGGMFLNDAFDHDFDAKARPERPIPSGQASAAQVHAFGFGHHAEAERMHLRRTHLPGWNRTFRPDFRIEAVIKCIIEEHTADVEQR